MSELVKDGYQHVAATYFSVVGLKNGVLPTVPLALAWVMGFFLTRRLQERIAAPGVHSGRAKTSRPHVPHGKKHNSLAETGDYQQAMIRDMASFKF